MFWWPFGVRSAKDGVRVDKERFEATFGRLRLRTARANVTGAHVTGVLPLVDGGRRPALASPTTG